MHTFFYTNQWTGPREERCRWWRGRTGYCSSFLFFIPGINRRPTPPRGRRVAADIRHVRRPPRDDDGDDRGRRAGAVSGGKLEPHDGIPA